MIQTVMNEHQRISILLALAAMPGMKTNDSMLQSGCAAYGHDMSSDLVRNHLTWLNEQGLIRLDTNGSYYLAELTARGQDVAEGKAHCPGVRKPRAK